MHTTSALAALTLCLSTFIGSASAAFSSHGLTILVPGGDNLWWVQGQDNNAAWTCDQADSSVQQFTILINNANTSLLTAITPLVAIEQNFNCEQTIAGNLQSQPVGSGYTLVLANINNLTDVYAETDPFEIKPLSAGYPPASATPVNGATTKDSASNSVGSATGSSSGSSATTTNTSAAPRVHAAAAAGVLAAAGAVAAFALAL